ncbi:MAG: threonine--tRNA ligase [Patescibacteria group bacterium]
MPKQSAKKTKDQKPAAKAPTIDLDAARHTAAHVLALAVKKMFQNARFAIGPVIENGFYYDFDLPRALTPQDLPALEKSMREIIRQNLPMEKILVPMDKAIAAAKQAGQKYKVELLEEIHKGDRAAIDPSTPLGQVTFYRVGDFTDLCRGGHLKSTGEIPAGAFKLTHIAGAYWKGDEKRDQLQRVYGALFATKTELDEYLAQLEEAKKRDHKILGTKLDLFTFSDLVGPGLPLWTPKGTILRETLDAYVWELRKKYGYEKVEIPHITKKGLFETSGHWQKFQNDLFKINTREDHLFVMKPMNCPHHTQIYARRKWSYRDLPQRYANTTMVYRDEQSGELSGLARVLSITQDDAHVFCMLKDVQSEVSKIWDIIDKFYKPFGFKLEVRLSRRDPRHPENYLGTDRQWQSSESALKKVMEAKNVWREESDKIGEAAFYGPKIDFMATDSLKREWQVATIQLDMNMPDRFNLTCINETGKEERIVMIHAAIMGSIERFLSIVIEHFAGAFPTWLAPVQTTVLPVSDKFNKYAGKVVEELKKSGIRAELDHRAESVGRKIRDAEMQKIPYMIVVGEKEQKAKKINVRKRGEKKQSTVALKTFLKKLQKEIEGKK